MARGRGGSPLRPRAACVGVTATSLPHVDSSVFEIAETLFISNRTAQTHVQHIFDRLDIDSRAGAVAYALQHLIV